MSADKIRVMLVDDHHVLRDGLRLLLESAPDMEVVGEAETGTSALKLIPELMPDIVVMDLSLPDISGIEVTRTIRNQVPGVRIVVLSMHILKDFVLNAIEAGADAYVPKSSTHESLLDAIRAIFNGERYLHPLAARILIDSYREEQNPEETLFFELTDREQDVFRLSAQGFSSREIGEKLIISPKTVDTYRQRAYEKLGIKHRSELVRLALKLGLLDDLNE